jgi:uncharacterized protein YfiM (DUF2279 family)
VKFYLFVLFVFCESVYASNYREKNLGPDATLLAISSIAKNNLEKDKFKHFIAGEVISYSSILISKHYLFKEKWKSIFFGLGMASFAGLLKEVYDKNSSGTYDQKDIFSTISGGALVSLRFSISF